MITGRELINGYYEDTKLYSTGDEDLDELLERAFCDGYEYAQKEFNFIQDLRTKAARNHAAKVIKTTRANAINSGINLSGKGKLGEEAKSTYNALTDVAATAQGLLPKKGGAKVGDIKINKDNLKNLKYHDATRHFYGGVGGTKLFK